LTLFLRTARRSLMTERSERMREEAESHLLPAFCTVTPVFHRPSEKHITSGPVCRKLAPVSLRLNVLKDDN
ncbi:hypothetical protein ACQSGH_27225, partial [Klebsiella pneumoniae]